MCILSTHPQNERENPVSSATNAPTVIINASFDEEAKVWYVSDSTYPGLNAEGRSLDRLMKHVRQALADLREVNGEGSVDLELRAARAA
jgi:hypothetical protein